VLKEALPQIPGRQVPASEIGGSFPALVAQTRARVEAEGLHHAILARLAEKLTTWSSKCRAAMR
jgi:hypothetical protein